MPRPGPRRQPINVRVSAGGREAIARRAAEEVGGDRAVSEMARRLLAYAVTRMPKGWTPESAEWSALGDAAPHLETAPQAPPAVAESSPPAPVPSRPSAPLVPVQAPVYRDATDEDRLTAEPFEETP